MMCKIGKLSDRQPKNRDPTERLSEIAAWGMNGWFASPTNCQEYCGASGVEASLVALFN